MHYVPFAGSLLHKERWLPCKESIRVAYTYMRAGVAILDMEWTSLIIIKLMMIWLQLECRYYHHYHNPVLTVPNTSKPDGIPQILESVNGGVFCKECGLFLYYTASTVFTIRSVFRKTLLLQTAFTFYFLLCYCRFPSTNTPDLGHWWAELSKKIPLILMRTERKSS